MKRKAIALAVGALFAAPAAHAQITFGNESIGTLQLYGKVYPQWAYAKGTGSTQPGTGVSTLAVGTGGLTTGAAVSDHGARYSVDSSNSYFGIRGERRLGGSLKGIWQIEQSVDLDFANGTDTAIDGTKANKAGILSNRNSFAGLSHGVFGTVKLGNMDTIYKEYGDTFSMFGIASGNFVSASNVLSQIGVGKNSLARFHERTPNSIQYQTADFAHMQAGVQYMPDEHKGNPGRDMNKNMWSFGVKWDTEMFYASLHREIHNDFFGASRNVASSIANVTSAQIDAGTTGVFHSTDSATRASGEFRFLGSQRIVLDISRLHYTERGQTANGKFLEYKKPTWAIGWDGGFGAWRAAVQYIHAGSGTCQLTGAVDCNTTGLTATQVNIGARYRFDRQTFVYLIASRLNNGAASANDTWGNDDPNRGEDLKQWALGISYSF